MIYEVTPPYIVSSNARVLYYQQSALNSYTISVIIILWCGGVHDIGVYMILGSTLTPPEVTVILP